MKWLQQKIVYELRRSSLCIFDLFVRCFSSSEVLIFLGTLLKVRRFLHLSQRVQPIINFGDERIKLVQAPYLIFWPRLYSGILGKFKVELGGLLVSGGLWSLLNIAQNEGLDLFLRLHILLSGKIFVSDLQREFLHFPLHPNYLRAEFGFEILLIQISLEVFIQLLLQLLQIPILSELVLYLFDEPPPSAVQLLR